MGLFKPAIWVYYEGMRHRKGVISLRRIITIGREFGSGGRELGRRLSEELGIAYYDQEIIEEIAKRTDMSEQYIRQISESRPVIAFPIHVRHSFYSAANTALKQSVAIFAEQHKLLKELAEKSDCVIVGRCADYILRDEKPLRIFVYADKDSKIKRCIERKSVDENLSEQQMLRKMKDIDKGRAKYYEFFSERKWGARENYDLMVNTSGADIKHVSAAIAGYMKNAL